MATQPIDAASNCVPRRSTRNTKAPSIFGRQRHDQSTTFGKAVEPQLSRVRRAGKHDDGIDLPRIVGSPVARHNVHLRPRIEVDARLRGECVIVFDGHDAAGCTHHLGQHGA